MERENHDLDDSKPEVSALGPPPISIHPHYPFVFVDLVLKRESPPLFTIWVLRPDLRSQLVSRWCALARLRQLSVHFVYFHFFPRPK